MRKQTKLVAVLSAAALLAIGASMTSFAATGWTEEDGTWVYYDKDGYKVESAWKKSGSFWYYLDEDGYMATSKIIEEDDNIYYVDETGKMVANRWVEVENEDYFDSSDDDEEPETVWYYFQNSGKAYRGGDDTSFKTINGKRYAFDSDGQMLFGWVNKNSTRETGDEAFQRGYYYCGDSNDGARVTNDWRQLYISDYGPAKSELEDQENAWFYFGANGEKVYATDDNEDGIKTKKINGQNYAFDGDGIMRADWQVYTASEATSLKGYFSDLDNGARKKGWFKAVPSEAVDSKAYNDDSEKWFYGKNDGKLVVSELKTINGKKYAFNEKGQMLSGPQVLYLDGNDIINSKKLENEKDIDTENFDTFVGAGKVYYFGSGDDGSMKTGNQTVEVDGTNYQFSFNKTGSNKGAGVTYKKGDKVLYVHGLKIKADADYKYQAVDVTTGEVYPMDTGDTNSNPNIVLVNTSGSIMKSTSTEYKDSNSCFYKVGANGMVLSYNESTK